jgi:hypothetical protein
MKINPQIICNDYKNNGHKVDWFYRDSRANRVFGTRRKRRTFSKSNTRLVTMSRLHPLNTLPDVALVCRGSPAADAAGIKSRERYPKSATAKV